MIVEVSFGNTEKEKELLKALKKESATIGESTYIKELLSEKLLCETNTIEKQLIKKVENIINLLEKEGYDDLSIMYGSDDTERKDNFIQILINQKLDYEPDTDVGIAQNSDFDYIQDMDTLLSEHFGLDLIEF